MPAIKVNLLFFGPLHDIVGSRQMGLELESPYVSDMLANLKQQYPRLENSNILVAVNAEYADAQRILNEGDEVALFTPVSGG